LWNCSFCPF